MSADIKLKRIILDLEALKEETQNFNTHEKIDKAIEILQEIGFLYND